MDDVESKLDLKNVLGPGSPDRIAVGDMISTSPKLQSRENRENFLNDCGLGELASEFNLDAKNTDFASSIINNLLRAEKLDRFLRHLLEVDKFLGPEDKRTLKKILGLEKPPAIKTEIRQMRAVASQLGESSIALKQPKKLDKQVLVRYGLSKPDQIPKIIGLVEAGQGCGVFSIFLEGKHKITREYIASRIILELREQQGMTANIHNEFYVGNVGSRFDESIERINRKIEDIKIHSEGNQCYIFLLFCSYQSPKFLEPSIEAFLNHQCIQSLQAKKRCCFMFIWIFEGGQFKKTEIKKLEKKITHFPVYQIVLTSFRNVIRTSFNEVGLCDRLEECFEKLDERKGEFFPTYEYLDDTFVNPSI